MGMLTFGAIVLAVGAFQAVDTATFRAPLHIAKDYIPVHAGKVDGGKAGSQGRDVQKTMNAHHANIGFKMFNNHSSAHKPLTVSPGIVPLWVHLLLIRATSQKNLTHDLIYFTEIRVGSPPQPIQALIDISSPDSFVPSNNCTYCHPGGERYNSSASSSFHSNGTAINLDYGYLTTSGIVAQDTISFGGLQVEDQFFQEANEVIGVGISWDDMSIINSIIGLTPSSVGSVRKMSSPFMNMASQGILDSNSFALRLREPREIMFGGTNRNLYAGNFTHIPLAIQTNEYAFKGGWQVEAKSMRLGTDTGLVMSLEGYTATFSTGWAILGLPYEVAWNFITALDFEDITFMPPSVSCERRGEMPDISINLAGHDFVLTAYDYTYKWPLESGEIRCVAAFRAAEFEDHSKTIILGSSFLRAFYTVFDVDSESIGCSPQSALFHVVISSLTSSTSALVPLLKASTLESRAVARMCLMLMAEG
ncbi:MAG: Vacuolar protease A, partial [Pleopsidium flavum]